jgi:hypothetical protein
VQNIDLGHDHTFTFTWAQDGQIKIGGIITHKKADGSLCDGSLWFDCEYVNQHFPNKPRWKIESMEPLTLSPSFLCHCGDHGYIRNGKWVVA